MSKIVMVSTSAKLVLVSIVGLAMLLSWAAAAHAQTSHDAQYGNPTASGEAAITASGLSGSTGSAAADSAMGSASATAGTAGLTGVLPSTGGPLVQLAALGAIALTSTGLLILRLNNNR